jgi:hypothetical protein
MAGSRGVMTKLGVLPSGTRFYACPSPKLHPHGTLRLSGTSGWSDLRDNGRALKRSEKFEPTTGLRRSTHANSAVDSSFASGPSYY